MNIFKSIIKLYEELGIQEPDIISDINKDYLTEHTARNGRNVLWYIDDTRECAIYADTAEILSQEEIEQELQ